MLYIFADELERGRGAQGDRLDITWQGLNLNAPFDDADMFDDGQSEGIFADAINVRSAVNYQSEAMPEIYKQAGGIEVYNPRISSRILTLRARLICNSRYKLGAYAQHIQKLFNPWYLQATHNDWPLKDRPAWADVWSSHSQPLAGYHLDDGTFQSGFTTAFPTGKIPIQYSVVPLELPDPGEASVLQGYSHVLNMSWLLMDAGVAYGTTLNTRSGNGTIVPSFSEVPIYGQIEFSMNSGAGAANLTIAFSSDHPNLPDNTLVLDVSGYSGTEDIVVNLRDRTITVDGVDTHSVYKSGAWPLIAPAGYTTTVTWSNTTNITGNVVKWRETLSA